MGRGGATDAASLIALLEGGEQPGEGELAAVLRRPSCPGRLVELLANAKSARESRRLLPLLLRHPACPRHFAWDALPRLGWRDLLDVARDPRTAPPVRRQAERKLTERILNLTLGERVALARLAPRPIIGALLAQDDPVCVDALLSNPQFTEADAIRLLQLAKGPAATLALLHHPSWGRRPEVLRAAVESGSLPIGIVLGLIASLPDAALRRLAAAPDSRGPVRDAARRLLDRRREDARRGRGASPLESGGTSSKLRDNGAGGENESEGVR